MKKFLNILKRNILVILFLIIIMVNVIPLTYKAFIWTKDYFIQAASSEVSIADAPAVFEDELSNEFTSREFFLNSFSLTQLALGKQETRNFEVLKDNDGNLFLHGTEQAIDTEYLNTVADEYKAIYKETISYGGAFLYVQCPYKNVEQANGLEYYSKDNTEEAEDYLVRLLQEKGIPVLDLRNYNDCKYMYKTDHHWTTLSAFNASVRIADEINDGLGVSITDRDFYGNIENYEAVTYNDCFLGSIGVKVGPYFAGKDDFTIYKPTFETSFSFQHFVNHELKEEYSGDFWQTFINQKILDDNEYNNKYNVNMHGAYCESIINNNLAINSHRGLLIAHSYGRSMGQYLGLYFKELRYLDPQKDRYNDNFVEYINSYQPEVVVLMYNDLINIGNGKWHE